MAVNREINRSISENVPSTKKGLKDGYKRVTYIVKEDIAYKLNRIAAYEDIFLIEVLEKALGDFLSSWEKSNHKITKNKK